MHYEQRAINPVFRSPTSALGFPTSLPCRSVAKIYPPLEDLSAFGGFIELTEERWKHITKEHPEVRQYRTQIQEVLERPDYVKRSKRDSAVLLYYRFYEEVFNGKYLLAVVKKRETVICSYLLYY